METHEIKNLEYLRELAGRYFNTLSTDKKGNHGAQIKVVNYCELGCFYYRNSKIMHCGARSESP